MRRWFAISGVCHIGALVALVLCFPARTTPLRARTTVFECSGVQDPAPNAESPEPEPSEPPEDRRPDAWAPESEEADRAFSIDAFDAESIETVRLPQGDRLDPSQYRVPMRRKLTQVPARVVQSSAHKPAPRGVTRAPSLLGKPNGIPYPSRARRRGLEGTVVLKLLVTQEGQVARVLIVESSGHDVLDEAARTAVARWLFAPALHNGHPVERWTRRRVHFRLSP